MIVRSHFSFRKAIFMVCIAYYTKKVEEREGSLINMNQYGYQQYKTQSINTMTQAEMLILLYDELIKRLTRAEIALKNQNYTAFDEAVTRCREIVRYLSSTLDKKYAISQELDRMYEYFQYELSRLSAGRKPEVIEEIKPLIIELRDTFKEADKINSANQKK